MNLSQKQGSIVFQLNLKELLYLLWLILLKEFQE